MRHSFFIVLLAFTVSVVAQIPVGYWRTHFSYTNTTKVLDTPDAVYGISTKDVTNGKNGNFTSNNAALFVYDKSSESTEILSKIEGLNESLCTFMDYSEKHQTLVLVYENSNIDLVQGRQVFNIPELKLKMMSVGKQVNGLSIHDNLAYLATDFGFVSINLLKREFVDTFIFPDGGKCYQIQYFNNYLFGFFEKGIWRCPISRNVMDKNSWEKISTMQLCKVIAFNEVMIGLSENEKVYRYSGIASNIWTQFTPDQQMILERMPDGFILSNGYSLQAYDENANRIVDAYFPSRIYGLSSVSREGVWVAGGSKGLQNYEIVENSRLELLRSQIMPVGPVRNEAFSMRNSGSKILVTAGGALKDVQNIPAAFYVFENENWWSADFSKVSPNLNLTGRRKMDLVEVIEDPKRKNRFFASSWEDGLYEFIGDSCVNLYTRHNTNEVLEELYDKGYQANRYRIGGLISDNSGNIWMCTSLASKNLVKVFRQDNQQFDQTIPNVRFGYLKDAQYTKSGNLWVVSVRDDSWAGVFKAIFVMNFGTSIDDKSDDLIHRITQFVDQDNQILSIGNFQAQAVDRNDVLWVGHNEGLFTIPNANTSIKSVLNGASQYKIVRPKVPRNDGTNYADYLMDGQIVLSIAVDGANRKWIGTENNGVYVVSENGTEVLANYNQSNSPLLGNKVQSIAIQPSSGEVFFGTNNGICSFRAEATEPQKDFVQVTVFPNPVRPDYSGLITITGLMESSHIRITDMNGNSVNEGKSLGGQYIWNGLNHNKRRVASGVYLVFAASNDGKQGVVAKIVVVK